VKSGQSNAEIAADFMRKMVVDFSVPDRAANSPELKLGVSARLRAFSIVIAPTMPLPRGNDDCFRSGQNIRKSGPTADNH
jgi:hypothetical protein